MINTATTTNCPDILMSGNCLKGEDCPYCKALLDVNLNVNAKGWVPKSKRAGESNGTTISQSNEPKISEKLQFNLSAAEYKPKSPQELLNDMEQLNVNEEEEEEDYEGEEFDIIMKDIINNEVMEELVDDEESDDEKWFPKFKDCDCCKGFVYKCAGVACVNMGTCYCKMKEECDDEEIDA